MEAILSPSKLLSNSNSSSIHTVRHIQLKSLVIFNVFTVVTRWNWRKNRRPKFWLFHRTFAGFFQNFNKFLRFLAIWTTRNRLRAGRCHTTNLIWYDKSSFGIGSGAGTRSQLTRFPSSVFSSRYRRINNRQLTEKITNLTLNLQRLTSPKPSISKCKRWTFNFGCFVQWYEKSQVRR